MTAFVLQALAPTLAYATPPPRVSLTPSPVTLTEGSSQTISITLSEPIVGPGPDPAYLFVYLSSSDPSRAVVTTPSVKYDASEWTQHKTFQIKAVDDIAVNGNAPVTISFSIYSDSEYYNDFTGSVPVIVIDDDLPLAVTAPATGQSVPEGSLMVTGTASANQEINVNVDGSSVGTTTSSGDGNWSMYVAHVTAGSHSVSAKMQANHHLGFLANQYTGSIDVVDIDAHTYVHDIHTTLNVIHGFAVDQELGNTTTANLRNITVSDLSNDQVNSAVNGFFVGVGLFFSGTGHGTMNAIITNTTIHNLIDAAGSVAGFGGGAFSFDSNASTISITVQNATVTGIRGSVGQLNNPSAAFFSFGGSTSTGQVTVNTTIQNTLLADNLSDSTPSNCFSGDVSALLGGSGPVTSNFTSLGHNMADEATCTAFTQTGDRLNVSNIASTLGPLQNNGGYVPTRALLAGSPAIGAGGQVLGISTDARGIARTGSFDVGAYQSVLGASTGSSSGGGLGNTGQNTKAGIMVGIFLISSALALVITKRKSKV